MKKIISLLIVSILCCSLMFVGCKNTDSGSNSGSEPKSFNQTQTILVANKRSDYEIIIPTKSSAMEEYAATELQNFLYESTGAKLNIKTDNGLTHDNSKKYLSVGNTVMLSEQKDIVVDYDLQGDTGPLIYTKGNTVYMCGAADYGTLYSVYKFLEYQIGFKAYAVDCVLYDYYNELKLLNFSYDYVPSIPWAVLNEYETYGNEHIDDAARMYRMGYNNEGGKMLFNIQYYNGLWCHSAPGALFPQTVTYVDEETGETKEKPGFYNGQPCLTDPDVLKYVIDRVKNLTATFNGPAMMIGMRDTSQTCNCSGCIAAEQVYKSQGGVLISFVNKLAKAIDEYLQEIGSKKTFKFVALVYQGYLKAPVVENSDGTYSPSSEEVIAYNGKNTKTAICIAPIHSCSNHPHGDLRCSYNESDTANIKKWAVVADELGMYIYGANFTVCQSFYFNDWSGLSGSFKFFNEMGVKYLFIETVRGYYSMMSSLKVYLKSKLAWDCNANVEEIFDEFFSAYYGPAAEYMREYLDSLNDQFNMVYEAIGEYHFDCHVDISTQECYPYSTLKSFGSILSTALSKVEQSNYTQEEKDIYYERVYREFILHKYNEWRLYKDDVEYAEKMELERYVDIAESVYGINEVER